MYRKIIMLTGAIIMTIALAGCADDADVASHNLSKGADNFEIQRRVVFLNGITDTYPLVIEGRCSIYKDVEQEQLEVTCKIGPDEFVKHFLGISDNVTYFAEQTVAEDVDEFHHRITFKPERIVPDIDLRTS